MRISDWSSDVCSSDLLFQLTVAGSGAYDLELGIAGDVNADGKVDGADGAAVAAALAGSDISGDGLVDAVDRQLVAANSGFLANLAPELAEVRSEERRVGHACVSKCRSGGSAAH